jgi:hypothetical protein
VRGGGMGQFDMPLSIVMDGYKGLIVANTGSRRVLLLDRNLNMKRVLLTWPDPLKAPTSISFKQETGQLFIGFFSGEVQIYRLMAGQNLGSFH